MVKLIPKTKKGYGILVFCNKCRSCVTKRRLCKHKDRWAYRIDIKINKKRLVRTLKAKDLDQAIVELTQIKSSFLKKSTINHQVFLSYHTLDYGLEKYIDCIHNKNGYESEIKNTSQHISDCKRVVSRFFESLENSGINTSEENINNLGVESIAPFYQLIKKKYKVKAQPSIDRHTRIMRNFINYLINSNLYKMANFFMTIKTKSITQSPECISELELKNTLDSINRENGWTNSSRGKRNVHTKWLRDAILLAQCTGLRREELYSLKWSNITEYKDVEILKVKDFKASRLANEARYKPVGVDDNLKITLNHLKSTKQNDKILSTSLSKSVFCDKLSRGFSHFFRVGNPGAKQKYFKQIRKLKITDISSYLGDETYHATGHSSQNIVDKHYIDRLEATVKYLKLKKVQNN